MVEKLEEKTQLAVDSWEDITLGQVQNATLSETLTFWLNKRRLSPSSDMMQYLVIKF